MSSKTVLYRPSWQRLRVSCLGVNHPNGGFTTTEGTQDNLNRLNNYLTDAAVELTIPEYVAQENLRMGFTDDEEFACRVWRILNLLNATRMGYSGQGQKGSPMDVAVEQYRDSIQGLYDGSTVVKATPKWNWDVVQFELEELWRNERFWFTAIYDDLSRRNKVAGKRRERAGGPQVAQTRPELQKFLSLMEAVNRV
jgi:hypothetical protein